MVSSGYEPWFIQRCFVFLQIRAAPETPFQSHLPHLYVTKRAPYVHTLLVDLGPQLASHGSCPAFCDYIGRPRRCLFARLLGLGWRLPLWGQDPKGRGSATQSVTTAANVHPTIIWENY
jgi:hypothetical protein